MRLPPELDLKTSLPALLDLVLPRVCVVCGRALMPCERHICLLCAEDLPLTRFAGLSHNPMAEKFNAGMSPDVYEPYAYAAALFHYSAGSGYDNITKALKYGGNLAEGRFFAQRLASELKASALFGDVGAVAPVPLHWMRRWKRGYNQAEVIARVLARETGVRCESGLLKRCRRTASQTSLDAAGRQENVRGAFIADRKVIDAMLASGVRHLLLVDDVFTTGATLLECYRAVRTLVGPGLRISVATLGYAG